MEKSDKWSHVSSAFVVIVVAILLCLNGNFKRATHAEKGAKTRTGDRNGTAWYRNAKHCIVVWCIFDLHKLDSLSSSDASKSIGKFQMATFSNRKNWIIVRSYRKKKGSVKRGRLSELFFNRKQKTHSNTLDCVCGVKTIHFNQWNVCVLFFVFSNNQNLMNWASWSWKWLNKSQ